MNVNKRIVLIFMLLICCFGCESNTDELKENESSDNIEETEEPIETSVEVSGEAIKRKYYLNEEKLDTTGIKFIVTYDNETTKTVTSDFTVTGFDGTKLGTQTVTVSYHGVSISYDIEIVYCSHEKDKGTITLNPTCVTKGIKSYKCSVCNQVIETEEIPELYSSPIDADTGNQATQHSLYIYFGVFPKSVLANDSPVIVDENESVSFGAHTYYKGSDGEYYAKVLAKPYESSYYYSDKTSVKSGEIRYFKVEPIKWKNVGYPIFLADNIITSNIPYNDITISQITNGKSILADNYQYSTIRAYLNGIYENDDTALNLYEGKGFLQTAFTPEARSWIKTSFIDNSASSTKNDDTENGNLVPHETYCQNTYDKIFLLSLREVTGFLCSRNDSYKETSSERIRYVTDYALANNAIASNRVGCWWLRTPMGGREKNCVHYVRNDGYILHGAGKVDITYGGIVPAISFIWDESERRVELRNENIVEIVETPSFNVPEGIIQDEMEVSITCETEDASIYYTTNGLTPTRFSTPYSTPIKITGATTIKAIAIKTGMVDSDVGSASYVKGIETAIGNLVKIPSNIVSTGCGDAGGPFILASYNHVNVNSFYMAENELTYSKWYEIYHWATDESRGESKYVFANMGKEGNDGNDGAYPTEGNSEPVTNISWRDAVVWCNAASEKEGLTPVYYIYGTADFTNENVIRLAEDYGSWGTTKNGTEVKAGYGKADRAVINSNANGYRLPTEAEWEYAARGGVPEHYWAWSCKYSGTSNEIVLDNYVVYNTTNTANVKTKKPNTAGLFDMSGNVMEWCQDLRYSTEPANKIVRGGSYKSILEECTVSHCGENDLRQGYYYVGFRVVRSILSE